MVSASRDLREGRQHQRMRVVACLSDCPIPQLCASCLSSCPACLLIASALLLLLIAANFLPRLCCSPGCGSARVSLRVCKGCSDWTGELGSTASALHAAAASHSCVARCTAPHAVSFHSPAARWCAPIRLFWHTCSFYNRSSVVTRSSRHGSTSPAATARWCGTKPLWDSTPRCLGL